MNNENQWATPTPLRPDGTNLLPFPVNALPPILRDMVQAIATTTSTDPAMASTAILSAVSYCFSGVYRMSAKRDHTEPLVLDALTVAEPSFKKSPVISMVKRPYIQFAHDWNENNKHDIFKAQAERKLLEGKLLALEKKENVTADEIAKLQTDLSNIPASNFRRIVVDDITPESLVNQLEENGTLLMISDEAGMLGNFSGRYSNNIPNLDLLLKSWNGETYISDRATRASIVLKKPNMSICLACQPYVFDSMISNTAFRGSGLIARFLYCFPVSNIGSRRYDTQPVPEEVAESYKKLVYKLLNNKFTYHDEKELYLHFDGKAYNEFVQYYNNYIEPKLLTDTAFCKEWGGKYHGLILRLCGIIHCVKCALNGENPVELRVNLDTFCNSIEIAEYYRNQAIYAFENNIISIRRTSNYTANKGVYTDTTKTRKSQRTLKFPQAIMDMLKEYKAEQDEQALKCGDKWVETDRLYTKWNGEPMQNGTPYFWLGEFCEKHDLPFYGLHSFRHLFASLLVNQGVDIVTVSGALGHSTVSTTSNIYCHMLEESRAKVSDAVSSALDFSCNQKEPKGA